MEWSVYVIGFTRVLNISKTDTTALLALLKLYIVGGYVMIVGKNGLTPISSTNITR
jgi:hypothetical protein